MAAPPLDYETQYIKRGILRSLTDPSSTCLLTIAKQQHHSGTTKVLSVQRDHNRLTTTVITNRPVMNPTRLRFEHMKQLSGMPVIHHTGEQTMTGGSGGMTVGGQHGGSNSMLVTDEMLMHFAREAQRLADEEEEEEQNAGYIYTSSEDGDEGEDEGEDDRDQFNQYDNADFLYRADQQLQQMEQELLNHMTQVVNELRSNMVGNDIDNDSERTHGADDDDNDDDLMHEGELSEEAISALWSGPIGSHGLYGRGPGSSDEEGDDDDDDENDYHMSDNENDRYYYWPTNHQFSPVNTIS